MTQFASTLYPQTNPTNPILLHLRNAVEAKAWPASEVYRYWLTCIAEGYVHGTGAHLWHARRVLNHLVAQSG